MASVRCARLRRTVVCEPKDDKEDPPPPPEAAATAAEGGAPRSCPAEGHAKIASARPDKARCRDEVSEDAANEARRLLGVEGARGIRSPLLVEEEAEEGDGSVNPISFLGKGIKCAGPAALLEAVPAVAMASFDSTTADGGEVGKGGGKEDVFAASPCSPPAPAPLSGDCKLRARLRLCWWCWGNNAIAGPGSKAAPEEDASVQAQCKRSCATTCRNHVHDAV